MSLFNVGRTEGECRDIKCTASFDSRSCRYCEGKFRKYFMIAVVSQMNDGYLQICHRKTNYPFEFPFHLGSFATQISLCKVIDAKIYSMICVSCFKILQKSIDTDNLKYFLSLIKDLEFVISKNVIINIIVDQLCCRSWDNSKIDLIYND